MNARLQALKKRHWDGRATTERRALMLGALALAPLVAYFLIWQPAHQASAKLRVLVPAMRAQAARLHTQAADAEAMRHRPHPAVLDAAALKTAVVESALRHQISISSLDAQPPNAVRLTMNSIAFETWLSWLRSLQQEQHIRAESVGIAVLTQSGMVKVSATLTNGGTQ